MSEVARDSGADGVDPDDAPPLAADRPYVDGTAASPEELRAEVERLSHEERQHVDDLREEVGDSVAALASRFDVKARVAEQARRRRRHGDSSRSAGRAPPPPRVPWRRGTPPVSSPECSRRWRPRCWSCS